MSNLQVTFMLSLQVVLNNTTNDCLAQADYCYCYCECSLSLKVRTRLILLCPHTQLLLEVTYTLKMLSQVLESLQQLKLLS